MIKNAFGYVLEWFYTFSGNYGVALILFSLAVKLILLPASAKGKKSMMKTTRLQPKMKQLELAYGDDKAGYQQAVQELYREEGVSPMGGCLWSFLPLLIIIPLYKVIQQPLDYVLHLDADVIALLKEAFAEETGKAVSDLGYYWQFSVASNLEHYGVGIDALQGIQSLKLSMLGIDLGQTPTWQIWTMTSWSQFGGALLPLISGALNYLSMFISQKMNNTIISNDKGEHDTATAQANGLKGMQLTMPLMSVVFGFMFPVGISVYWVAQSVLGIVQDVVLTQHYRKVYDAEDALKRDNAAKLAAEEAEKERIRAAKRAANPNGIVENTSKKKQQLREKQDRDAAAKSFENKKRSELGLPVEEETDEYPGGEPGRPYARGRAYSAEHYGKNKE